MNSNLADHYRPMFLTTLIGPAKACMPISLDDVDTCLEAQTNECWLFILLLWSEGKDLRIHEAMLGSMLMHPECYAIFYFGIADACLQEHWLSENRPISTSFDEYHAELLMIWHGVYTKLMSGLELLTGAKIYNKKEFISHLTSTPCINLEHPQFHLCMLGGNFYSSRAGLAPGSIRHIMQIIKDDPLMSKPRDSKDGCLSWTAIVIYLVAVVLVIIGTLVYIAIDSP